MGKRIQVILADDEKEALRARARRDGVSLSAWLRRVALERLREDSPMTLDSPEALRVFFERCDDRETGHEPEWAEHRRVIDASIAAGSSKT